MRKIPRSLFEDYDRVSGARKGTHKAVKFMFENWFVNVNLLVWNIMAILAYSSNLMATYTTLPSWRNT